MSEADDWAEFLWDNVAKYVHKYCHKAGGGVIVYEEDVSHAILVRMHHTSVEEERKNWIFAKEDWDFEDKKGNDFTNKLMRRRRKIFNRLDAQLAKIDRKKVPVLLYCHVDSYTSSDDANAQIQFAIEHGVLRTKFNDDGTGIQMLNK
jgi:hypothetical protein